VRKKRATALAGQLQHTQGLLEEMQRDTACTSAAPGPGWPHTGGRDSGVPPASLFSQVLLEGAPSLSLPWLFQKDRRPLYPRRCCYSREAGAVRQQLGSRARRGGAAAAPGAAGGSQRAGLERRSCGAWGGAEGIGGSRAAPARGLQVCLQPGTPCLTARGPRSAPARGSSSHCYSSCYCYCYRLLLLLLSLFLLLLLCLFTRTVLGPRVCAGFLQGAGGPGCPRSATGGSPCGGAGSGGEGAAAECAGGGAPHGVPGWRPPRAAQRQGAPGTGEP